MNINLILDFMLKKVEKNEVVYSEEFVTLLKDIKETIRDMDNARNMFNFVSDPKLIGVAIHSEDVAKARYDYLINIAKSKNMRILR